MKAENRQANRFENRSARARALAEKCPAASEVLDFYAGVAAWQAEKAPGVARFQDLVEILPSLVHLVAETGPDTLADAGKSLPSGDEWILSHWEAPGPVSPREFFARTLMQLYAANLPEGLDCPWCTELPLVGCLTTLGDGQALHLVCALCFTRRPAMRGSCPSCLETQEGKLVTYSTPDFDHLRLIACDACRGYLMAVDLEKDTGAIPEVDELSGLPLGLWASEQGYRKLQPNIAGV